MRKIQVLGTGCPKCKQLAANVEAAVKAGGIEARVEKVDKIQDIMKFGVMMTPALVVDGQVKSAGKVLSAGDIEELLNQAGKIAMNHSCGSVVEIVPDLIDIGLDALESVQPEAAGMNPYELKRAWGASLPQILLEIGRREKEFALRLFCIGRQPEKEVLFQVRVQNS